MKGEANRNTAEDGGTWLRVGDKRRKVGGGKPDGVTWQCVSREAEERRG
jgi:hypothetical protein